MVKVRIDAESSGQWRLTSFQDYSIKTFNAKKGKIVLEFDEGKGGTFRPERSPLTIELKFKGASTFTPSRGEFAGQKMLQGGQVTKVLQFDKDGGLIAEWTDLTMDAGLMHLYLLKNMHGLAGHLISAGAEVTVEQNDDFANSLTGGGDDVVRVLTTNGSYTADNGGTDQYLGHKDGYDIVSYDDHFWISRPDGKGIKVDLSKGQVKGPGGEIDKLQHIDEIRGTNYKDVFLGNGKDNTFQGLRGNDELNGRKGFDIARYDADDNIGGYEGILANMGTNKVRDGYGTVDKLKNIEGVSGTDYDDTFISGNRDDWFRGRDGADTFKFNGKAFGDDYIRDFNGADGDVIALRDVKKFGKLTIEQQTEGTLVTISEDASIFLRDYFSVSKSDFDLG